MMMIKQRLAVLEDNIYSVPAVVSGARVRTSHIASNPLPLPDIPHAGDSWWIGGVKTGQFLHGNCWVETSVATADRSAAQCPAMVMCNAGKIYGSQLSISLFKYLHYIYTSDIRLDTRFYFSFLWPEVFCCVISGPTEWPGWCFVSSGEIGLAQG